MQPTYLPWLGYFDLMDQVDIFIFLDNVQFAKRSWQQRNRIKTPRGLEWLTVPVIVRGRYHQLIKEVEISDVDFWKKHVRAIELNYSRAPYFEDFFPELLSIFENGKPWKSLLELNTELIKWLTKVIGIKTPVVRASSLGVVGKRTSLLAAICQSIGATRYISPIGSAGYLLGEIQEFTHKNIEVFFHHYTHPTYNQLFPPFLPFASVIDLVFNEGPKSLEIIQSGRGLPYSPEEICDKMQKGKG
jgi:hypothetical protein